MVNDEYSFCRMLIFVAHLSTLILKPYLEELPLSLVVCGDGHQSSRGLSSAPHESRSEGPVIEEGLVHDESRVSHLINNTY